MTFNNGFKCFECGWTGLFNQAYVIAGENYCPMSDCRSPALDPVVVCRTCEADEAQDETGQCITCCPIQADDPDPFECEFRRDTVQEVKPLLKGGG